MEWRFGREWECRHRRGYQLRVDFDRRLSRGLNWRGVGLSRWDWGWGEARECLVLFELRGLVQLWLWGLGD